MTDESQTQDTSGSQMPQDIAMGCGCLLMGLSLAVIILSIAGAYSLIH